MANIQRPYYDDDGAKQYIDLKAANIYFEGDSESLQDKFTAGKLGGAMPRLDSTAYKLGDYVSVSAISNKKMVCVQAGVTGAHAPTISSTDEGVLVTDGTVTWIIDSLADGFYTAEHQNGIYKGADLTAYWESGLMSTNIQAGNFIGMHIGDYVVKAITVGDTTHSDIQWIIAGFDYHLNLGNPITSAHHVLVIPNQVITAAPMVSTGVNTTTGGYIGSEMWTTTIPVITKSITDAFGVIHVLSHYEMLTNSMNEEQNSAAGAEWGIGATSSAVWTEVFVNIPSEAMIFGRNTVASSYYEIMDCSRQLPLYANFLKYFSVKGTTSNYWLRTINSMNRYASVSPNASISVSENIGDASNVLPYFLLQ